MKKFTFTLFELYVCMHVNMTQVLTLMLYTFHVMPLYSCAALLTTLTC